MKKSVFRIVLSIMIFVSAISVLAAQEGKTFNVDLCALKSVYTSDYYTKNYTTNQSYWNNKTASYHDGTVHDLSVNLQKSNGSETEYKNIGTNDTYVFSNSTFKKTGSYRVKLRNSTSSIYKYWTSGIWYYSV